MMNVLGLIVLIVGYGGIAVVGTRNVLRERRNVQPDAGGPREQEPPQPPDRSRG